MTSSRSTPWSRREWRGRVASALATLVLVFAALTVFVTQHASQPRVIADIDHRLRAYPGAWRYALATWLRSAGSAPIVAVAALLAGTVVCWVWRRGDLALLCLTAPLLAGLAEVVIKSVVGPGATRSASLQGAFGAGFPSGHTAGIAALAAAVVICTHELSSDRRARRFSLGTAGAVVIAVATSSVVGGAHRSLDVVGGVLLGVAATLAVFLALSISRDAARRVMRSAARQDVGGTIPTKRS